MTCERELPIELFRMVKGKYPVAHCDGCYPTVVKYRNIWRKFKLTREEYDELVRDGCSVCGSDFRLAVDHDHTCCASIESCGKCIRGVLCMRHNVALGQVGDSVEELYLLIKYLESK